MRERFTHKSNTDRGRVRPRFKKKVYERDDYTCQFCGEQPGKEKLTIDHLIPVSKDGRDEITNYVTCCEECNQRKADMPLSEFAETVDIEIENLPVHGDPVIDNADLPDELRAIRKRIYEKMRKGEKKIRGTSAQKKIEKNYRRDFWDTSRGKALEKEFPNLPGQVRIMIPEIKTIAKNEKEYLLLIELAKSAATRNLIGTILNAGMDIVDVTESLKNSYGKDSVRKRIGWAWERFQKEVRKRDL